MTEPTGGPAMFTPHSSGVNSTPIGQVEMNVDALRMFANRDLGGIFEEVHRVLGQFDSLPVDRGIFGTAREPSTFAGVLLASHEALGAALRGFAADVDRFGDQLRKACENQQQADDAAAEALQRAVSKFGEGGYESQRAFSAAVAERTATPAAPQPVMGPVATTPATPEQTSDTANRGIE